MAKGGGEVRPQGRESVFNLERSGKTGVDEKGVLENKLGKLKRFCQVEKEERLLIREVVKNGRIHKAWPGCDMPEQRGEDRVGVGGLGDKTGQMMKMLFCFAKELGIYSIFSGESQRVLLVARNRKS